MRFDDTKEEEVLLDTYSNSKHELTKSLSSVFHTVSKFQVPNIQFYVIRTLSGKGPNIQVRVGCGGCQKSSYPYIPRSGTTFKSCRIQSPSTKYKKEQQYVLNKFIKICGCK